MNIYYSLEEEVLEEETVGSLSEDLSQDLSDDPLESMEEIRIRETIQNIFLLDFYEKKFNKAQLVANQQLVTYMNYFDNCYFSDVSHYPSCGYGVHNMFRRFDATQNNSNISTFLDEKYPLINEILLFGKGKISICGISVVDLMLGNESDQHNLFFCCDIGLAKELLLKILELLDGPIIHIEQSLIFDKHRIRICLDLYKSEDQILLNIGPNPERHGYNPKIGYFGTISSVICLSLGIYPIDLDFKERNISRYSARGFKTVLHGSEQKDCVTMKVPNGSIVQNRNKVFCDFDDEVVDITEPWTYYNSSMKIYTMEQIKSLPSLFKDLKINRMIDISIPMKIPTIEEKRNISNIKYNIHRGIYRPYINHNLWFGKHYKPHIVGISDERFLVFHRCKIMYNVSDDVFRMLCDYWLRVEVDDAREVLLSLN